MLPSSCRIYAIRQASSSCSVNWLKWEQFSWYHKQLPQMGTICFLWKQLPYKVRCQNKKTILFGNLSQHGGGGLPKSQNFCKFTKYFFVCQIHSKVLKHVSQRWGGDMWSIPSIKVHLILSLSTPLRESFGNFALVGGGRPIPKCKCQNIDFFCENQKCSLWHKMQNKHYFFFYKQDFPKGGVGGGVRRFGKNSQKMSIFFSDKPP